MCDIQPGAASGEIHIVQRSVSCCLRAGAEMMLFWISLDPGGDPGDVVRCICAEAKGIYRRGKRRSLIMDKWQIDASTQVHSVVY